MVLTESFNGSTKLIYGTAWKKENTASLVQAALCRGFRKIDTASQPRHYREDLVGDGIRAFLAESSCRREDLWVQTKFTPFSGQDDDRTLPYDRNSPLAEQIRTSIDNSLFNLRPTAEFGSKVESYIDCYMLHIPLDTFHETLVAWTTIQAYVPQQIRSIGIANITPPIFDVLQKAKAVTIKPVAVQNPFYAESSYDVALRTKCRQHGVRYQAYGVLKRNDALLNSDIVVETASVLGVSRETMLIRLVAALEGVDVLDGTTNEASMERDIAIFSGETSVVTNTVQDFENLLA